MNDDNTIETTEGALKAAIDKSIEKRLDITLEKLAKIEGMLLGIQAVIVEWQGAKRGKERAVENWEHVRKRLKLAEEAMLRL